MEECKCILVCLCPTEVEEERLFVCEMGYGDCEERGFCNGDC